MSATSATVAPPAQLWGLTLDRDEIEVIINSLNELDSTGSLTVREEDLRDQLRHALRTTVAVDRVHDGVYITLAAAK